MADKLISQLDPAITPLNNADLFEIEQGVDPTNTSGKVTLKQISDFCAQTAFTTKNASGVIGAGDAETIEMNVATANTLTIQNDSVVNLPDGSIRNVMQLGSGQTTLVADTGVTIQTALPTLKTRVRYSVFQIVKRGANLWYVWGDAASS